jgi:hypothetical protein
MLVIAHILGVPVEEYALPLLNSGAGILLVLASRIRRLTLKRREK